MADATFKQQWLVITPAARLVVRAGSMGAAGAPVRDELIRHGLATDSWRTNKRGETKYCGRLTKLARAMRDWLVDDKKIANEVEFAAQWSALTKEARALLIDIVGGARWHPASPATYRKLAALEGLVYDAPACGREQVLVEKTRQGLLLVKWARREGLVDG